MDRRYFLELAALGPLASGASGSPREVDVFQAGENGYHTFRIPALLTTRKGTLLAFAEGRKNNARDHGDIDLVVKRSTDGGSTWSAQSVVHEQGGTAGITIGNPCPVVENRSGNILLPFTRDNNDVFVTTSSDDGHTWSEPANITASVKKPDWTWYATGPGVGIQVRRGRYKGRLVIPCDHREERVKVSHVFYSDDGGRTWKLGGSAQPLTDECQVAELADGSLLLNMRNYQGVDGGDKEKARRRAVSRSTDGGETWPDLWFDDALVEPVCQASLIAYPRKRALLFANPASRESRVRMTVRASLDGGKTWPHAKTIHDGPSAYSCLTVLRDRRIGLLYERGARNAYERITFAGFPFEWLTR